MNESTMARIPVRPLSYDDRDLALPRELVIDYSEGNIFITDKEDPSILIDITKLIAESYLSNINGDNTTVTINGEKYNLSELLTLLKNNSIEILNAAGNVAVPADVNYDHVSVTIKDNIVSLFGFGDAGNHATPMKKDGQLVWISPEDTADPSEPKPGANINVIDISPTNDSLILYNKPFMYTNITTTPMSGFLVRLPLSMPMYSRMRWKVDTAIQLTLSFPTNMVWIADDVMGIPLQKIIAANNSYIIEMETWDFGATWIVTESIMLPIFKESEESDLPTGYTYLVDDGGALLSDDEGNLLVLDDAESAVSFSEVPTVMPRTAALMALGASARSNSYYIKKITDLVVADSVDSDNDKIFLNQNGSPKQAPASSVATKVSSAGDVPYTNDSVPGANSVAEALDKLLHTETSVSFTYSTSTTQQKGAVLQSFQIRWEYSKSEISSQSIDGVNIAKSLRAYTESEDISSNRTYKFMYDDGIETYTKNISIRFLNGIYYGTSSSTAYNAQLINSLTRRLQDTNKGEFTVNAKAGEYIYYACPVSYGTPTFTINGLDVLYNNMIEFDYVNSDGYTERYAIYRSTYSGLGTTKITSR